MLAVVAPTLLSWAMCPALHHSTPPATAAFATQGSQNIVLRLDVLRRHVLERPFARRRAGHLVAGMSEDGGLRLPLSSLSAGLTAATEVAVQHEMAELEASGGSPDLRALEADEEELCGRRAQLLDELGDTETAGLVFQTDGMPSASTLGLALVLTARRAAELDFTSVADLVMAN
jgi:hypothetical protein